MDPLLSLLESNIGTRQAVMLATFLFFLPIFFFAYWAVKRGAQVNLRPIAGFALIKNLLGQSAETGNPVHLSIGTSGVGGSFTADTTAGLEVVEYLAERGAVSASPPLVTCANPTALPVAQDLLRRAYRQRGYPEEYDPTRARLVAPTLSDPADRNASFAYAAGVMQILDQQKLTANVMIGHFGDEFLLMGETGARRDLQQIGGTSATSVLPFVKATMTHPIIGEEIYAGGAYLSDKPAHISSLLAQDILRWILVAFLVVAVLARTLGLF